MKKSILVLLMMCESIHTMDSNGDIPQTIHHHGDCSLNCQVEQVYRTWHRDRALWWSMKPIREESLKRKLFYSGITIGCLIATTALVANHYLEQIQ